MHQKTLTELRKSLDNKEFSSVELTQHYLDRIAQHDPELNSFITVSAEHALEQATLADQRLAKGEGGALTGIPIAQKDIFCTDGIKTSCGSKMLDNFIAPYNATVIDNFTSAGAVMLGKTNMDEFAMGSSNETSFYGLVHNPWLPDRIPGGSSGGSAAAVAARLTPGATGTDTGGSIRQPAAHCGITGIKPSYGRVSRYGMIAFASSLDQGGPMAPSAQDCALLLNVMSSADPKDSTNTQPTTPTDFTQSLNDDIRGLKIGLPKPFFAAELSAPMGDAIQQVIEQLRRLGAEFVDIDMPHLHLSVPAYYVIAPAEASSNLARFDGVRFGHRCDSPQDLLDLYTRSRAEGFGDEVKRRIMVGTYALSSGYYDAYYIKAQQIRRLISEDFNRAFEQVDLLLGPTTPEPAFKLGEKSDDPLSMYLSDIYTIGVNLAGLPGLAMPAGFIDGCPIGAQLIGPYFQDARLLNVAHQYQQVTDWHLQIPSHFAN